MRGRGLMLVAECELESVEQKRVRRSNSRLSKHKHRPTSRERKLKRQRLQQHHQPKMSLQSCKT